MCRLRVSGETVRNSDLRWFRYAAGLSLTSIHKATWFPAKVTRRHTHTPEKLSRSAFSFSLSLVSSNALNAPKRTHVDTGETPHTAGQQSPRRHMSIHKCSYINSLSTSRLCMYSLHADVPAGRHVLRVHLAIFLSLSIVLSVHLSVFLSVCLPVHLRLAGWSCLVSLLRSVGVLRTFS